MAHIISVSLFAVLASTVGMVGHASAATEIAHTQVEHSNPQSPNCATVCLSGPVQSKKTKPTSLEENDDNQPSPPYYLQFTSFDVHQLHTENGNPPEVHVDDKVPKYRLCCVIQR